MARPGSIQWLPNPAGVIRVYGPNGEDYEFAATVHQIAPGEVEILGVDHHITTRIVRAVKDTLRAEGWRAYHYERHKGGRVIKHRIALLMVVVGVWLTSAVVSAQRVGPQKAIVMPVNSANNVTQTFTQAELQAIFANGSPFVTYWWDQSYGTVGPTWTAEVQPWQTSPATVDYNGCGAYGPLDSYAQARRDALYGTAQYSYRHFNFYPPMACSTIGVGNGTGAWSTASFHSRVNLATIAHELGHGFGFQHAQNETCDPNGCQVSTYGDAYTVMRDGGFPGLVHVSYADKMAAQWVGALAPGKPRAVGVATTQDVTLEPYEQPTTPNGIVAAIVTAGGASLVLEARTRGDADGQNPGVIIRSMGSSNVLLDLDRATGAVDYVLNVGQTYARPDLGVAMTTLAFGAFGATIRVTFPGSGAPPMGVSNLRAL